VWHDSACVFHVIVGLSCVRSVYVDVAQYNVWHLMQVPCHVMRLYESFGGHSCFTEVTRSGLRTLRGMNVLVVCHECVLATCETFICGVCFATR
jgi:hypothetical protein